MSNNFEISTLMEVKTTDIIKPELSNQNWELVKFKLLSAKLQTTMPEQPAAVYNFRIYDHSPRLVSPQGTIPAHIVAYLNLLPAPSSCTNISQWNLSAWRSAFIRTPYPQNHGNQTVRQIFHVTKVLPFHLTPDPPRFPGKMYNIIKTIENHDRQQHRRRRHPEPKVGRCEIWTIKLSRKDKLITPPS